MLSVAWWLRFHLGTSVFGLGHLRSRSNAIDQPNLGADAKLLCRVTPDDSAQNGGRKLDIWQLPGNARAVSFEDALTYETMLSCSGPAPECEQSESEVSDIQNCHPCECTLDRNQHILESQQALVAAIQPHCITARAGRPFDILMLGLGGGVVHTLIRSSCPQDTRVRSVEIDSRFAAVASRYFGLPLSPRVSEVVVGDALQVVRDEFTRLNGSGHQEQGGAEEQHGLGKNGWDAIVVDCFVGSGRTAPSCRANELVQDSIHLLKPGGIVMQHVWHHSPKDEHVAAEYDDLVKEYHKVFGEANIEVKPVFRRDPAWRLDDIIMATKSEAVIAG